jgi:hypothetical protein
MQLAEERVLSFIHDYEQWNGAACAITKRGSLDKFDEAEKEHEKLVSKYYHPRVKPQGISYGSNSSHSIESESVTDVEAVSDDKAIVTTLKQEDGYTVTHKYHLEKYLNEWRLTSLLYVEGRHSYECL